MKPKHIVVVVVSCWIVYRVLRYWHYKKLGIGIPKTYWFLSNWDDQLLIHHEQRQHYHFLRFLKDQPVMSEQHATEMLQYCVANGTALLQTIPLTEFVHALHHLLQQNANVRHLHTYLFQQRLPDCVVNSERSDYSGLVMALAIESRLWKVFPVRYALFRALLLRNTQQQHTQQRQAKAKWNLNTLKRARVECGNQKERLSCLEILWVHLEYAVRSKQRELSNMLRHGIGELCDYGSSFSLNAH